MESSLEHVESEAQEADEEEEEIAVLTDGTDDEDDRHFPPLYTAIVGPINTVGQQGDNMEKVLQLLVADSTQINEATPHQGWTPLMVSGSTGQPAIMRELLARGADVSSRDRYGNSAYDWTLHIVRGYDDDIVLTLEPSRFHAACVALLRLSTLPWCRDNHHLFPAAQRREAFELLLLGRLLTREPRRIGDSEQLGQAFYDCWVDFVIPHAVERPELVGWHSAQRAELVGGQPVQPVGDTQSG